VYLHRLSEHEGGRSRPNPGSPPITLQGPITQKNIISSLNVLHFLCIVLLVYSDSLRAGRSGNRIPVGARFSAPAQTGPGAHPTSYTVGTGSFQGVKRSGHGIDHPPYLVPGLKKEWNYTSTPPLGLRGLF
jgi:hypothetical protein